MHKPGEQELQHFSASVGPSFELVYIPFRMPHPKNYDVTEFAAIALESPAVIFLDWVTANKSLNQWNLSSQNIPVGTITALAVVKIPKSEQLHKRPDNGNKETANSYYTNYHITKADVKAIMTNPPVEMQNPDFSHEFLPTPNNSARDVEIVKLRRQGDVRLGYVAFNPPAHGEKSPRALLNCFKEEKEYLIYEKPGDAGTLTNVQAVAMVLIPNNVVSKQENTNPVKINTKLTENILQFVLFESSENIDNPLFDLAKVKNQVSKSRRISFFPQYQGEEELPLVPKEPEVERSCCSCSIS